MNFSEKLQKLRKERGMSQENLAEVLGVSRQAVSRWESGGAYPEMDKLIVLSEMFGVTLDWLVKDNDAVQEQNSPTEELGEQYRNYTKRFSYEYKSKKMLLGLPLVHVNLGNGARKAEGILAVGNIATGVVSVGIASIGLVSFGVASIGIIGIGAVSAALFSIGAFAFGAVAIGAIAVGLFAFGGIAVGMFTFGALSVASHIAIGHTANGQIAIGEIVNGAKMIEVEDINRVFVTVKRAEVQALITEQLPNLWKGIASFICNMFRK